MRINRKLCILLMLSVLSSTLSGCYDSREVDDLAYVIAIGLDKAKTNHARITLQFAVPTSIGSGSESGGGGGGGGGKGSEGGENKNVYNLTLEAPSILSGINLANNVVSKQINLSHTKVLVFSRELALEGLGNYVVGLSRVRELRPNTTVLIARDSSEEFLKAVSPQLVSNTAKYYEQGAMIHERTGFTVNTQFHDLSIKSREYGSQAIVTLAGINKYKSSDEFKAGNVTTSGGNTGNTASQPSESGFAAGEMPRVSKNKAELMGLAVFDGGRMVGELNSKETVYHLMVTGEYNYSNATITDPYDKKSIVILSVKKSRNPVHRVEMRNGKPYITVKIMLEADVAAIQNAINYNKVEKLRVLEAQYEKEIGDGVKAYLKRTSKELHSDICGFGTEMSGKFLTWDEWKNFNWLSRYKDASFNVDVDLVIRRPGLALRSMPIISSEGAGRQ